MRSLLRHVLWEHRPQLILFAVEPIDEEHLHCAATVPVALLVVGAHFTHTRAKALRNDGREVFVAERCRGELPLCSRRAADEADLPVRPWLRAHPIELVVGISQRRAEDVVVALGEEVAALIHLDQHVATFHGFEFVGHVAVGAKSNVPVVEVVWRAAEDDRILLARVFGAVDVGGHARAVPHRHHHLAVDDSDVFELLLDRLSLFDEGFRLFWRERLARTLGEGRECDGAKRKQGEETKAHDVGLPDLCVMQAYQRSQSGHSRWRRVIPFRQIITSKSSWRRGASWV